MKKKNRLLSKVMALCLAATMAFGLSVTAFAADPDGDYPGGYNEGASKSGASKVDGYPADMGGSEGSAGVPQWIDVGNLDADVYGGNGGSKDDRGTIKVVGLEPGLIVTAYQVIAPVYNDEKGGIFAGWADVDFDVVINDGDNKGKIDDSAFSRDDLNGMASKLVKDKGTTATADFKVVTLNDDGAGTYSKSVEPGAYIVVASRDPAKTYDSETKTYGAMLVSVYYTYDDNVQNDLKGHSLTLTENMAFAKVQDAPTIKKAITELAFADNHYGEDEDLFDDEDGKGSWAIANVGDKVWFDIRVNNIPEYHGDKPVFVVRDYMDTNLKFTGDIQYGVIFGHGTTDYIDRNTNKIGTGDDYTGRGIYNVTDEISALIGEVKPVAFTSSVIEDLDTTTYGARNELVFDFVSGGKFLLNKYAGYDLVIRYEVEIVDKADDNDYDDIGYNENGIAGMPNRAALEYTHNSNVTSSKPDLAEPTKDKTIYTAKIKIRKVDAIDDTPLKGATFDVALNNGKIVFEGLTSDDDGYIYLSGITYGEYVITEKTPPEGYSKTDIEYWVWVNMYDGDGNDLLEGGDGVPVRVDYNVQQGKSGALSAATVDYHIPNVRMTDLPTTGGTGTALLIGLGICGAIAACFVIFGTRKKSEEQ